MKEEALTIIPPHNPIGLIYVILQPNPTLSWREGSLSKGSLQTSLPVVRLNPITYLLKRYDAYWGMVPLS